MSRKTSPLRVGVRSLIASAAMGAVFAALDCGRSLAAVGANDLAPLIERDLAGTVLWHVGAWAVAGFFTGLVLGIATVDAGRKSFFGMLFGTLFLLLAGAANVFLLPAWTSPLALTVSLGTAALCTGLLILLLRSGTRAPGRMSPLAACTVLILGAAFAVSHCQGPDEPVPPPPERTARHPSVLLLVVDSLRADRVSNAGYERDTTPNLSRFGEDALVFREAYATAPWTKPSVASLLTGLPPAVTAAEDGLARLPEAAVTVAELLRSAGYSTALFSDNLFVTDDFGLAQGFDRTQDQSTATTVERFGLPRESLLGQVAQKFVGTPGLQGAAALNRDLLTWLDGLDESAPFFGYVHYMEPHLPYHAPPPWNSRYSGRPLPSQLPGDGPDGFAPFEAGVLRSPDECRDLVDAYDAEVLYWDHTFGQLLSALKDRNLLDRIVLIVAADHGESFFEHRTWFHGNSLHEELIHVPLLIRVPEGPAGAVAHRVSLASVAPTILHAAGYDPGGAMEAFPLLPPPTADRLVTSRVTGNASGFEGLLELAMIRGSTKWILSRWGDRETLQCFDLDADRGEQTDLVTTRGTEAEKARPEMVRRAEAEERRALEKNGARTSPALDQALRGLGYLR